MSSKYEDFLIEEFKQNWEYIRQSEDIRIKHTQLFFIISAAIMSFFAYLLKGELSKEDMTFIIFIKNYKVIILSSLLFLSVYSLMITLFIFFQKNGYEQYRKSNKNIRTYFIDKGSLPFKKDSYFIEKVDNHQEKEKNFWNEVKLPSLKSPFTYWLLSIAIMFLLFFGSFMFLLLKQI
jgi:ATP-dependent Zn protease